MTQTVSITQTVSMTPRHRRAPSTIGSLVGATFGFVFVAVNSSNFPTAASVAVRIVGAAAFLAVVAAVVRLPAWTPPGASATAFGRLYWFVVALEVILLFAGVRLLAGPMNTPEAGVAWVAVVVGVHFLVLARVWSLRMFVVLGGALVACGALGAGLAVADAGRAWIDLTAGVFSGVVLLAFSLWGALQGRATQAHRVHTE